MATENIRKRVIEKAARIVIKLGSNVLTTSGWKLDRKVFADIARTIATAKKRKKEFILVSSGAIAAGMGTLGFTERPRLIPLEQAAAAIGQISLMGLYQRLFSQYGFSVAQVLLTHSDLKDRKRFLNARHALSSLLAYDVIPIINENWAQSADQAPAPAGPATPKPLPSGPFVALDVTQGRATLGTIVIALNREKAPLSVENFLQYVRAGHYDGTVFHRVMPGFRIQGGGYTPELEERPTRPPIKNEARSGLRNSRGTVAMARPNDPDSASSQFFINVRHNHRLDFGIGGAGYAVFGEVVEGMDVVDKIVSVTTTTKGDHANVPITPIQKESLRL